MIRNWPAQALLIMVRSEIIVVWGGSLNGTRITLILVKIMSLWMVLYWRRWIWRHGISVVKWCTIVIWWCSSVPLKTIDEFLYLEKDYMSILPLSKIYLEIRLILTRTWAIWMWILEENLKRNFRWKFQIFTNKILSFEFMKSVKV